MSQAPVGAAYQAAPGGSVTTTFLARRGLQVALFGKSELSREKVCGDDGLRRRDGSHQQHLVAIDSVGVTDNGKRRNG